MANTTEPINVAIEPEEPKDMDLTVSQVKHIADYGRRSHDKWLINERSGASIMFRNNGQTNMAAGRYSQYKLNPQGSSQESTLVSQTITNRKILQSDEFIFNNHKFNTQLIDLADFRKMKVDQNQNCIVGNFTVFGSVLVKAWEENLKRYVLIRRPARMSLFSPLLNVPDIMPASQIRSPLKSDEKLVGISDKGYQVNMIIYDHKTLIGKEGVDREGIDRSAQHSGGYIGMNGESGGAGLNTNVTITSSELTDIWKALKKMGFNDVAAAGLMGCFAGESGGSFGSLEGHYLDDDVAQEVLQSKDRSKYDWWARTYLSSFVSDNPDGYDGEDGQGYFPGIGLAQWTGVRAVRLFNQSNGEWWKPEAQIQFAANELNSDYAGTFNEAQAQSQPEDAARIFAIEYEGGGYGGYADDRAARAREIYDQFAGSKTEDDKKK